MDGLPLELESAISDIESGDYSSYKAEMVDFLLQDIISPSKFEATNETVNKQKQDELAKLYNATQQNTLSTLGRKDGIDPNQQFTTRTVARVFISIKCTERNCRSRI